MGWRIRRISLALAAVGRSLFSVSRPIKGLKEITTDRGRRPRPESFCNKVHTQERSVSRATGSYSSRPIMCRKTAICLLQNPLNALCPTGSDWVAL